MKNAGLPLTTQARITYVEVIWHRRLAYLQLADFIPGVLPYDVRTTVDLEPTGSAVRMILTFDAMHNEDWTQRAVMGRESEFGRLSRALQARAATVKRGRAKVAGGRDTSAHTSGPSRRPSACESQPNTTLDAHHCRARP
jgi:hypothetical protein